MKESMRVQQLVTFGLALLVCVMWQVSFAAQTSTAPRQIHASRQPIVSQIKQGERNIRMSRTVHVERTDKGDKSYVAAVVERSPIIFTGQVIRKEPAFLDIWNTGAGVLFTVVPMAEATWIGSSLTVRVERVIQTTQALPLNDGGRVEFVVDFDGSATVMGTRVDTETPWRWPIEQGKRYLIAGHVLEIGRSKTKSFYPDDTWLEPFFGGPLRGPVRKALTPDQSVHETPPTFEQDGAVPTDIFAVTERLEAEVTKRKSRAPK